MGKQDHPSKLRADEANTARKSKTFAGDPAPPAVPGKLLIREGEERLEKGSWEC